MQDNPLLNKLAFDIVKDKVIEDKTKDYMQQQEKKQKESDEIEIQRKKTINSDLKQIDKRTNIINKITTKSCNKNNKSRKRS